MVRAMKSLASWCTDIVLWIIILAVLLLAPTYLAKVGWNLIARTLGLAMLNFLEVWAFLISLATIAIIIFFLYFGLEGRARKTKWWRAWREGLRSIQAKVRKRG